MDKEKDRWIEKPIDFSESFFFKVEQQRAGQKNFNLDEGPKQGKKYIYTYSPQKVYTNLTPFGITSNHLN